MNIFEWNRDGQVIEWRKHMLSDMMHAKGADDLIREPILRPEAAVVGRLLVGLVSDESGIRWTWREWKKLKAVGYCGAASMMGSSYEMSEDAGTSLRWEDLLPCDHVDVTPSDAHGRPGATLRVERPLLIAARFADFEHVGEDIVCVELLRPSFQKRVFVRLYKYTQRRFKPTGDELALSPAAPLLIDCKNLRGYIAVIFRLPDDANQLADFVWYDGHRRRLSRQPDEEEIGLLRAAIERNGEAVERDPLPEYETWLARWPQTSQWWLRKVFEQTADLMGSAEAGALIQSYPAGVFRAAVLHRCQCKLPLFTADVIRELAKGSFPDALKAITPSLPEDFVKLPPPEQDWVIRNLHRSRVVDAVKWASGRGVQALDLALTLMPVRDATQALLGQVRNDCYESRMLRQLYADLTAALTTPVPPQEFYSRLNEVKRRIEDDRNRFPDPEAVPPVSIESLRTWELAVTRMNEWRTGLGRAILYCETGRWVTDLGKMSPEELTARLAYISAPPRETDSERLPSSNLTLPQERRALDLTLQQELLALEKNKNAEPRKSLRDKAGECLRLILGDWPRFEELIGEIREALEIYERDSPRYAWLKHWAGLDAPPESLGQRAAAAGLFLAARRALGECLATWPATSLTGTPNDRDELYALLLNPAHPRVEASRRACDELSKKLSWPRFSTQEAESGHAFAAGPSDPSAVASLKGWWDQMRRLDGRLTGLRRYDRQFRAHAEYLEKNLLPRVQKLLDGVMAQEATTVLYQRELETCCQKWLQGREHLHPDTVRALVRLLVGNPDWQQHLRP